MKNSTEASQEFLKSSETPQEICNFLGKFENLKKIYGNFTEVSVGTFLNFFYISMFSRNFQLDFPRNFQLEFQWNFF